MTEFLFMAHSGFRYIVLLVGLAATAAAAAGLASGATSNVARLSYRLYRVFVVTVDIQVLLGIAVILTRPFLPIYIGHLVMMLLALMVAHGVAVMLRRRPAERREPGPILAGVAVTLAIIAGGILSIGRPIF